MLFLDAPLRMAVRAVKGGGGKPFIGAKRRPLTEQAGGTGACFASEEQLKLVRDFYRRADGEVLNVTPCHGSWQGVRTCLSQRFAGHSGVELKDGLRGLVIGLQGG